MKCFVVHRDEIDGRIDPFYYKPEFRKLNRFIKTIKVKKLGDIAKFQYGLNETAKEKGDILYIRITDIDEYGLLKKDNLAYLNYKDKYKNYKLKKGDLLIARIGTFGKSYYFNEDFDAVFAGYLIRINLISNEINPKYLFYFFQTKYFWQQANMLVKGGVQPQFNANTLKHLSIPIPSLETQEHIVQIMDEAYNIKKQKEAEAQQLLDSINDYVLSEVGIKIPVLKDQMTFSVYPDDVKGGSFAPYYYQPKFKEIEKAIEKGKYELVKLGDINEKEANKPIKLEPDKEYNYLDITSIDNKNFRIRNFQKGKITELPNNPKKLLKKGDVLISKVRPYLKNIAIFELDNKNKDYIATSALIILRGRMSNPFYVLGLLSTDLFTDYLMRFVSGSTYPTISQEDLLNLKIPLPPLEIQNKIAEEVKKRMQKTEQLQKEAKEILEKAKQKVENIILNGENNEG